MLQMETCLAVFLTLFLGLEDYAKHTGDRWTWAKKLSLVIYILDKGTGQGNCTFSEVKFGKRLGILKTDFWGNHVNVCTCKCFLTAKQGADQTEFVKGILSFNFNSLTA